MRLWNRPSCLSSRQSRNATTNRSGRPRKSTIACRSDGGSTCFPLSRTCRDTTRASPSASAGRSGTAVDVRATDRTGVRRGPEMRLAVRLPANGQPVAPPARVGSIVEEAMMITPEGRRKGRFPGDCGQMPPLGGLPAEQQSTQVAHGFPCRFATGVPATRRGCRGGDGGTTRSWGYRQTAAEQHRRRTVSAGERPGQAGEITSRAIWPLRNVKVIGPVPLKPPPLTASVATT